MCTPGCRRVPDEAHAARSCNWALSQKGTGRSSHPAGSVRGAIGPLAKLSVPSSYLTLCGKPLYYLAAGTLAFTGKCNIRMHVPQLSRQALPHHLPAPILGSIAHAHRARCLRLAILVRIRDVLEGSPLLALGLVHHLCQSNRRGSARLTTPQVDIQSSSASGWGQAAQPAAGPPKMAAKASPLACSAARSDARLPLPSMPPKTCSARAGPPCCILVEARPQPPEGWAAGGPLSVTAGCVSRGESVRRVNGLGWALSKGMLFQAGADLAWLSNSLGTVIAGGRRQPIEWAIIAVDRYLTALERRLARRARQGTLPPEPAWRQSVVVLTADTAFMWQQSAQQLGDSISTMLNILGNITQFVLQQAWSCPTHGTACGPCTRVI